MASDKKKLDVEEEQGNFKAAALGYMPGSDQAPRVVASGRGEVARSIMRIAKENGVPFYSDEELVDSLLKLRLDAEVPVQLYEAIAHVLAYVYSLDKTQKEKIHTAGVR